MPVILNGQKDPERIEAARNDELPGFHSYRKTTLTYAALMPGAFLVDTLEGVHSGKAGDYLAIGAHGEMYPIDAAVFEETYERVCCAEDMPE